MQIPTLTGVRVRSARDANILFHAVAVKILPLIFRRLDEAERLQVRSGCVYVWEERNPSYFESNGQEMKRFTEGRSWGPSKARDEFLFYYEKENGIKSQMVERMSRARLVKQTYSVNVHSPKTTFVRKWHINAYYCAETVDELAVVDDIPSLKNLQVPHELYTCARTSRARDAAIRSHTIAPSARVQHIPPHTIVPSARVRNMPPRTIASSARMQNMPPRTIAPSARMRNMPPRTIAPSTRVQHKPPHMLPPHSFHSHDDHDRNSSSSSDVATSSDELSSPPTSPPVEKSSLAPLEYLENLPRMGRHPMDEDALRLFDSVHPVQKLVLVHL